MTAAFAKQREEVNHATLEKTIGNNKVKDRRDLSRSITSVRPSHVASRTSQGQKIEFVFKRWSRMRQLFTSHFFCEIGVLSTMPLLGRT